MAWCSLSFRSRWVINVNDDVHTMVRDTYTLIPCTNATKITTTSTYNLCPYTSILRHRTTTTTKQRHILRITTHL